ncbi:MAG TPA: AMP-binding protein, partial [Ramlibacter sp.]|nr:AMP-binding protein [Ramlibacter sp.]
MQSTMMPVPLSLNHFLERAGRLFAGNALVSRLPDKSYRRHTYGEFHRGARSLAAALVALGLRKGERVATLCWNHHAHLECYFGIAAAGGVPLEAAARHALAGGWGRRAGGADPRLRPARHLDPAGLGHDRDLARLHHLLSARRTARC